MRILLVKPKPRLKTILRLQPIVLPEPLELGYVAAAVPPGQEVGRRRFAGMGSRSAISPGRGFRYARPSGFCWPRARTRAHSDGPGGITDFAVAYAPR